MKRLTLILLLIPLLLSGQSQTLNGITLNGPRGFEKSYRALEADFGFGFLFVGFLTLLFFIGYAVYSPSLARTDYLALISFHGFLELVMLAYSKQERTDELDNSIHTHASH